MSLLHQKLVLKQGPSQRVVMRNDVHMRINMRCFSMTAYEGFFMALVGKWPRKKREALYR
jgi:hypothetical protein